MSRGTLIGLAVALGLAVVAVVSGALLMEEFWLLLDRGPGAVAEFTRSRAAFFHEMSAYVAAVAACGLAASGLIHSFGSLLGDRRRLWAAVPAALLAPLVVGLALGAVVTGHSRWDDAQLGDLQPDLLESFAAVHGKLLPAAFLLALFASAVLSFLLLRPAREED